MVSPGPTRVMSRQSVFGSGWNVNDFVFFPERYDTRRQALRAARAAKAPLNRGQLKPPTPKHLKPAHLDALEEARET